MWGTKNKTGDISAIPKKVQILNVSNIVDKKDQILNISNIVHKNIVDKNIVDIFEQVWKFWVYKKTQMQDTRRVASHCLKLPEPEKTSYIAIILSGFT